MVIFIAINNIY